MRNLSVILVALALVCIETLIGGVRMVFSLPAYILLAGGVLTAMFASRNAVRPPLVSTISAMLLAGWVIIRSLNSPVAYLARTDLLMVLAALLLYLALVVCFRGQRVRLILTAVLLALALVHVGIGAVQFKQADNFMLLPGIMRPSYEWRASGFYICPNHLAGLLEMIGLLAVGLACWSNGRPLLRVVAGYSALMCFAGVAITGSRGGYLSVVFGLGVFAILSLWVVRLARRGGFMVMLAAIFVGGALVIGGGLLFMFQSTTLQARLGQIYEPKNPRLLLWKAALKQYHLQPITGTGSGTYLYYGRQFRAIDVQDDPMHVHNDYLELLAEYGIVGVALGGIFLLVHLGNGLAGLRKIVVEQIRPGPATRSNDLALNIGALSAIGALLFHSLVDFNVHIPANALVLALLFGLLASPVSESSVGSNPEIRTTSSWRLLMAVGALVLLALSLRFLPGEYFTEKARVALRDDRNADALDLAQRGLEWEKRNPNLYADLGDAQHFLTLTAPDAASARFLHEDAVASFDAGLKLFPQDTGLLLKKVQDLDQLERFAEAEEVFQLLFRYDPLFANVYAYYGLHCQLQRHVKTAERCFRIAMRLGETEIAPKGLQHLERLKNDPVSQSILSALPETDMEFPVDQFLPKL